MSRKKKREKSSPRPAAPDIRKVSPSEQLHRLDHLQCPTCGGRLTLKPGTDEPNWCAKCGVWTEEAVEAIFQAALPDFLRA